MKYKYPRTYHLPYSKGYTSDDKVLSSDSHFYGKEVVITEKMDGENTSIYNDGFHARSLDSAHKPYHSWLLAYIQNFKYMIPENYRICGEYLYAKHSIDYDDLSTYFMCFSVWNNTTCLSWKDTIEFCNKLGLTIVPILYKGIYDLAKTKNIAEEVVKRGGEGIVVRVTSSFEYKDFDKMIAKYVRENHVQTNNHWGHSEIQKNNLKK